MSTEGSVLPDIAVTIESIGPADAQDELEPELQSPLLNTMNQTPSDPDAEHVSRARVHSIRCAHLHRAARSGTWTVMKPILQEEREWLCRGITKGGETVLHIAAAAKHLKLVKKVIKYDKASIMCRNRDGRTPFHFAAASGVVEIAKAMLDQNGELAYIRCNRASIPLLLAIQRGHKDMSWFLLKETHDQQLTDDDRIQILNTSIDTDLMDVALHVLKNNIDLAFLRDSKGETALHALARKPLKNENQRRSILCELIGKIRPQKENVEPTAELGLTKIIWKQMIQQSNEELTSAISVPWPLIFTATRLGKVKFLTVLIENYPDLIWQVDDDGCNIFQVAVMSRNNGIFNLIHEFGDVKDVIATYEDKHKNNMLHIVSKMPHPNHLNHIPGAAAQMRRELQWFQAVKEMVRSDHAILSENDDKETPESLFSKEHEGLRKQAEQWYKKTAESCALVAALTAAMVFSAAYQLPGGFDDKGSPVLEKKGSFQFYVMFNAISLVAATASLLMFLSILTSEFAERQFLVSLPLRLEAGVQFLHVSITFMMYSFYKTLDCVNGDLFVAPLLDCLNIFTFLFILLPLGAPIPAAMAYLREKFQGSKRKLFKPLELYKPLSGMTTIPTDPPRTTAPYKPPAEGTQVESNDQS